LLLLSSAVPLPGTSLVLFDEEGNFIHDASREPNKRVRNVAPVAR
jgi:hypothetical protein